MTIKQKLCKYINGEKEYYLDDKEYHTFQEIKDFCYEQAQYTLISEKLSFTFVLIDTDEEINIISSWKKTPDDFYYVVLETKF